MKPVTHNNMRKFISLIHVTLIAIIAIAAAAMLISGCSEGPLPEWKWDGGAIGKPGPSENTGPDSSGFVPPLPNDASDTSTASQDATGSQTKPTDFKPPYVTFDVPEGWEFRNEQNVTGDMRGAVGAISNNGVNFKIDEISAGHEAEAEKKAKQYYDSTLCKTPPCTNTGSWPDEELKTIALPNGVKLFADIGASSIKKEWYTRDNTSTFSWESAIWFSKDGYVFLVDFTDRPDLYIDELNLMTSTLKTEQK